MKPSLRWCVRSLRNGILALTLAACSSGTPNEQQNDAGGGSDVGAGGGDDGGTINGTGGPCSPQTQVTEALKLTLSVTWPGTLAVQQPSAPGSLFIWLLSSYSVDSQNKLSGKVRTCGNQTPPITLTMTGAASVGAPMGATAQVQITIPTSVWNAPTMPTTAVTGTLGGWNIGSSFSVDPVVTLSGLKATSTWASPSTMWPASVSMGSVFPMGDITDDDGDGKPGITATPSKAAPFYVPRTGLDPTTSPPTDKLYVALRTALSLNGKSTSCTEGAGTATVTLLNNHVIGCHIPDADGGAGTDCIDTQYDFIDSNTTAYVAMGGTYASKQLMAGTGDGGAPTCDDVLAALP